MTPVIDPLTLFIFIIMAVLGGLTNVLISTNKLGDLKKYRNYKKIVIAGIIGVLYYFMHSEYSFPNGVMSFVAGYMGQDFITRVVNKFIERGEA